MIGKQFILEKQCNGYILIGPMTLPSKIVRDSLKLSLAVFNSGNKYYLIEKGNIEGKEDVLFRINSKCVYADIFGSERCDCREQLHDAMQRINKEKEGLIIYAYDQDGRGINLKDHLRVYMLQDHGLDTVEANEAIGLKPDHRDYSEIIQLLKDKNIKSVRIMTNNPARLKILESNGIKATRVPIHSAALSPINIDQLAVKKSKLGHLFEYDYLNFWINEMKKIPHNGKNIGEFADPFDNVPVNIMRNILVREDGFKIAQSNDLSELVNKNYEERNLVLLTLEEKPGKINNPSIKKVISVLVSA